MKSLTALFSIGALSFAASTMANAPATQLHSGETLTSLEKKLTMSCYENRVGDRLYVGAAETVTFCREAARRTIAEALQAETVEIAAIAKNSETEVN